MKKSQANDKTHFFDSGTLQTVKRYGKSVSANVLCDPEHRTKGLIALYCDKAPNGGKRSRCFENDRLKHNEIGLKPARQQPRSSRVVGESRDLFMLSVAPTGSILKPKNLT